MLTDVIRKAMTDLDLDAYALASKLGVSANTVWRYLAGTVSPSAEALSRLAQIADLDLSDLLTQKAHEQHARRKAVKDGAVIIATRTTARTPHSPKTKKEGSERDMHKLLKSVIGTLTAIEGRLMKLERWQHRQPVAKKA